MLASSTAADATHLLSADSYSSGELAYKLNAGYEEGVGARTYYTLKDGKTVFGDENNQTLCVTINKVADATYTEYLYINKNETLTVPVYANYTCTTADKEIKVTDNTTLTYNLTGIDCAETEAILAEIGDLDASLFTASAAIKAAQDAAEEAVAYAEIANPSETDRTNAAAAIADAKSKYEALSDWSMVGAPNYADRLLYAEWYTGTTYNIDSEADWLAAVESGKTTNFSGITLNFTDDITMTQGVEPLCNVRFPFAGTIQGNDHVINNLKIDCDVAITPYIGLIGYASNATVENLGIASGKITVTGTNAKVEPMIGSFFGRGLGSTQITHCWNAAEVYVDAMGSGGISVSGIGRLQNGTTIDGCYNIGKLTSVQSTNVSGLNDWPEWTGHVYNSFAIATIKNKAGTAGYLMRQKDWGDTPYQSQDPYPHSNSYAVGGLVFNDVYKKAASDNPLVDEASFELAANVYTTGELAYRLNTGYTGKGTATYYKVVDSKTVFATEATATRKLTVRFTLNGTDAVKVTESFVNGGDTVTLPVVEGYTLNADALVDYSYNATDSTIKMPAKDLTVIYTPTGTDYKNLAAELVKFYDLYKEGYENAFDLFTAEDEMNAAYAAAASIVDGTAAEDEAAWETAIASFVAADELELKNTYPYYPSYSNFDTYQSLTSKDANGRIHWAVSSKADWEYILKNGFDPEKIMDSYPEYADGSGDNNTKINNANDNFVLILHITRDIDFNDEVMKPAVFNTNLTIDGHNHVFKNVAIEKNFDENTPQNGNGYGVALIADSWNCIIQNLGLEGGYVKATGETDQAIYASSFVGYQRGASGRLYNCWSTADVSNEVKGTTTNKIASGLGNYRQATQSWNCYYAGELSSTGGAYLHYHLDGADATTAVNHKNIYGVGDITVSNATNASGTIVAAGEEASGKLAITLNAGNQAISAKYPVESVTWTVSDGVTTFGTPAPVQVTFQVDYDSVDYDVAKEGVADVTLYTDSDGKVLATAEQKAELNAAADWGTAWTDTYTEATNTVTGTPRPAHTDAHTMGEAKSTDGVTHTAECTYVADNDVACTYTVTAECAYGDWTETEAPSTTTEGKKERTCSACGYVQTGTVAKLPYFSVTAPTKAATPRFHR